MGLEPVLIFVDWTSEPQSRADDVGEQGDDPQQLVIAQVLLQKITDALRSLERIKIKNYFRTIERLTWLQQLIRELIQ